MSKTQKTKKNNKDTNKLMIVVAVLLVLALIAGGTYAYWLWRGNITNMSVTVDIPGIGLTLDGGAAETIDLAPSRCNHPRFADKKVITIKRYNESNYPAYIALRYNLESFTWTKGSTTPTGSSHLKYIRFAISSTNFDTSSTTETCSNAGTLTGNTSSTATSKLQVTYAQQNQISTGNYVGSLNVSGVNVGTKNTPVTGQNKKLLTWIYELPALEGTEAAPITETYYLYTWIDPTYPGTAVDPSVNGSGTAGLVDPLQDMTFVTSWSAGGNIEQVNNLTDVTSYSGA